MSEGFAAHVTRRVRANGLDLFVREWTGPMTRTALVLHGYLDHSASFVPLGDALARAGWRVLAPDFRGHGHSAWAPVGAYYHFPDYIADIASLVDQLAPADSCGPLAIVAHSMGGTVATMYTGSVPDRVRALVLMEGMGPPSMPADAIPLRMGRWLVQLARPRVRERKVMASVSEAADRLHMTHGGQVPDEVIARVAEALVEPHPSGQGVTWRFDPLHQTTSPARFDAEVFAAFARRVTAPVLILDGGAEGLRHADDAVRRTWYARHEDVSLAGAGHMMHWTRPDDVAASVVGFLTACAT